MRRAIRAGTMGAAVAAACLAWACHAPLRDGKPRQKRTQVDALAPVDLEALAGRHWVLQAWSAGEAAPRTPVVTFEYREGRFAGRSGCNRYTTALTAGSSAKAFTLGPIAGTRMMCPEPAMAVEARFLGVLARARRLGWRGEDLAIISTSEAGVEVMLLFAETRAVAQ